MGILSRYQAPGTQDPAVRIPACSAVAGIRAHAAQACGPRNANLGWLFLAPPIRTLPPAFDHVVVDEAQDLSVTQLRFLSALAGGAPNGLFFAGDLGQRIFQQPFSWKSLGADVRGRSRTLHITYRTPHQIRLQADRLLGPEVSDVHGNSEDRTGTVSVFNGPVPIIRLFKNEDQEVHAVANWLCARVAEGFPLRDMAVFVRADAQIDRPRAAADLAGIAYTVLDGRLAALTAMPGASSDALNIATMHLAKGLEFRAVAVMACDD